MLLFNGSSGAVNAMLPDAFGYQVQPSSTFGQSLVQSNISCQTYSINTNNVNCVPSIGNTASAFPNVVIFGDWWGVLLALYQFIEGAAIPGWFLFQFGVPAALVGVFSLGIYALYLFMFLWIRSGRPL